jgi:hypothetical protein
MPNPDKLQQLNSQLKRQTLPEAAFQVSAHFSESASSAVDGVDTPLVASSVQYFVSMSALPPFFGEVLLCPDFPLRAYPCCR